MCCQIVVARSPTRPQCDDGGVTSQNPAATPPQADTEPRTAVFRISPLSLLAVLALGICAIPVAFGAPWLWLVYVVPLGLAFWVLRVRTTAGPDDVVARGALRATRVRWADIAGLRLRSSRIRSRVSAVLRNGSELPLPAVHVRDLPLLAAVSGGRLPDPSATPAEPEPQPAQPEPAQPQAAQPEAAQPEAAQPDRVQKSEE